MDWLDQLTGKEELHLDDVPKDLGEVSRLATELLEQKQKVEKLEAELKHEREQLERIETHELPAAMIVLEIDKVTVQGVNFECKPFYRGHISKDNQAEAFAWLEENGHDALIKHEVVFPFGKGESDQYKVFMEEVLQHFPDAEYKDTERVHPQTLYAFIREQTEKGVTIPDSFSPYIGVRATIKKG